MSMARGRIVLGSALAVFATSLCVVAHPADAQAACPAGVAADQAPTAQTEASAQRLAVACAKPVEVLAGADETTKVMALPSGDFTLDSYLEPQRVKRGDRWLDLDTRLEKAADGRYRPRAAADVSFSAGGGTAPFATYREGGADFTLSWPTVLPPGVVSGDSVTYPNVYPDVDLVVRAVAGGFSHVLVVRTPEAAANPAVRESSYVIGGSATVSATNDEIVIKGPKGVVAGAPRPVAWDSNRTAPAPIKALRSAPPGVAPPVAPAAPVADASTARAPGDLARRADLDVRISEGTLKVRADESLLAAASAFPVYIDPVYSKYYQKWIPVSKLNPDSRWTSGDSYPRDVMRVGSNWDNHSDVWRAHTQFDISILKGKRLIKTPSVDAYVVHTGACAGESLELWQTNGLDGDNLTWNGMKDKWLHGDPLQTRTVKANSGCSGQTPNWVKFDASGIESNVQRHADAGFTTITFGLRVPTESGGHWVKVDRDKVKLTAEYQSKPTSPVAARSAPGGACNHSSPGPWINDSTPTLYGTATDADNSVRIVFDLTGPTSPADFTSRAVASKAEGDWTTPTLADGSYKWRVQGTDGTDSTAWTDYCYFRQDHTPPTLPEITRTSGQPVLGQPVTLSFSSTDALSGVQRFEYGVGVDTGERSVNASSGKASVTFTPDSGRTQIYVWATDNAGNRSARAIYNVFTGRVTPIVPMGVWRFSSDLRDDSGTTDDSGNKDVHADEKDLRWSGSPGPTYTADHLGKGGAALEFNGNTCASTMPVLRSDVEFTAAAWVKLGDKSTNRTVLTISGADAPAFMLGYHAGTDRWETALTDRDSSSVGWTAARSTTSPPLNTWQYVAASVDPVGKVLRLYVDGKLVAETAISSVPWRGEAHTLIGCGRYGTTTYQEMIGAIDQVGMWSGLLSEAQIAAAANELPAGVSGAWMLRKTGADDSGHGYDLSVPEPVVAEPNDPDVPAPAAPTAWTGDQYARPESAWYLTGDRCATSARSVVRSDESFSLAVWARLDDTKGMNQTIIGADGNRVSGWFFGARANGQGVPFWSLMMKASDDEKSSSDWAYSTTDAFAATVGKWTHLVGTYNATTKTITLYVNGEKVSSVGRGGTNWAASGPLTIGCGKYAGVPADYFRGAITDVRVWRGVLTDAEATALKGANPPVKLEGMWPLEGPGSDEPTNFEDRSGNSRHLSVAGAYSWERDRFATRQGALGLALAEGSCAETGGPVVRTDGSFSVAAWVSVDDLSGTRTVVSQPGAVQQGFRIEYDGTANRWRVVMPQSDSSNAPLVAVSSLDAPAAGTWTHVAAVFDLPAKKLRFYVDGEPQGEVAVPSAPWHASGPLTVGCTGSTDGRRSNYLGGVVDDVRVWSSTVDPDLFGTFAHA
ncbi:LamG-like jellyroll fold domain-containing protein [Krasilnikovia sp. M28-CT-15]|uniref:LamG-like jellyroll fold domain-containing protein n=1 Tax=Krasilnikovia sp. M28-CT-15 TaxID=3373540 RepID=UPI00399D0E76